MTWAMTLNGGELIRDGERVRHEIDGAGFQVEVLRRGTFFGNPQTLTRTMNTLMTQGTWETTDPKRGNRSPALVIQVEGETSDGLNAAEIWLSDLMHPGALEWLPPRHSAWTVFDVTSCYIDRAEDDRWDLDEQKWIRRYLVPIKALPYARSKNLTITPADAEGAETVVDDGSSASPWAALAYNAEDNYFDIPVTVEADHLAITFDQAGTSTTDVTATRTGTVDATGHPYLAVEWSVDGVAPVSPLTIRAVAHGATSGEAPLAATELAGDVRTSYFRLPAGNVFTGLAVQILGWNGAAAGSVTIKIHENGIRLARVLPSSATGRQKSTAIVPGGSAPTDGSLHVGHPSEALGVTVVYTYPLGRPSPALMQYRTESDDYPAPVVVDATQIHGYRIDISSDPLLLTIPDFMLPTRGLAALWTKLLVEDDPVVLSWHLGAYAAGDGVQVGFGRYETVALEPGDHVVPLNLVNLPTGTVGVDGSTQIVMNQVSGAGSLSVAEVWAFGQDDESGLTIVNCGEGTPNPAGPAANNLWINAPSFDNPAGEVLIGTDPANARWPSVLDDLPQQAHKFPSKGVAVLTVTSKATNAGTALTHYRRSTHHAGS